MKKNVHNAVYILYELCKSNINIAPYIFSFSIINTFFIESCDRYNFIKKYY